MLAPNSIYLDNCMVLYQSSRTRAGNLKKEGELNKGSLIDETQERELQREGTQEREIKRREPKRGKSRERKSREERQVEGRPSLKGLVVLDHCFS